MFLLAGTLAHAEAPKRNLDKPEDLLNAIYADYRVIKECALSSAEMAKLKTMLQAAERKMLERKPDLDTNAIWNSNVSERNIASSLLKSLPADYNMIALAPFLPGALLNNVSPLMCQSAGYIMLDLLNRAAPEVIDSEFRKKNAKDF